MIFIGDEYAYYILMKDEPDNTDPEAWRAYIRNLEAMPRTEDVEKQLEDARHTLGSLQKNRHMNKNGATLLPDRPTSLDPQDWRKWIAELKAMPRNEGVHAEIINSYHNLSEIEEREKYGKRKTVSSPKESR
jgi:hypothetical protein